MPEICQFTTPVIVFAIKSYFFSGVDNYDLEQKFYICYSFLFFCEEIIKIVYAIFVIRIKYLKMHLNNSNLLIGKSAICFKFSIQKKETKKQIADILNYKN